MTDPAPKPIADRIRDVANELKRIGELEREKWLAHGVPLPMTLSYEARIPDLNAIASEIEEKAGLTIVVHTKWLPEPVVFHNITEIHYRYDRRDSIAFESDIDTTGMTYPLDAIVEFEAKVADSLARRKD